MVRYERGIAHVIKDLSDPPRADLETAGWRFDSCSQFHFRISPEYLLSAPQVPVSAPYQVSTGILTQLHKKV